MTTSSLILNALVCLEIAAVRARSSQNFLRIRSEEHTSELQSRQYLVCRLLLEKKTSVSLYLNNPPFLCVLNSFISTVFHYSHCGMITLRPSSLPPLARPSPQFCRSHVFPPNTP